MTINNKGITLVEIIIVVALLGIIIVPLGTVFITNYITYFKDTAKVKATADMRSALSEVLSTFRLSKQQSIVIETSQRVIFQIEQETGGTIDGVIWYDSAEKSLKLKKASTVKTLLKNVSGTIIENIEAGRISVKVTTVTNLPFNSPFIYTQTYDYNIRTKTGEG